MALLIRQDPCPAFTRIAGILSEQPDGFCALLNPIFLALPQGSREQPYHICRSLPKKNSPALKSPTQIGFVDVKKWVEKSHTWAPLIRYLLLLFANCFPCLSVIICFGKYK
jgi:hypothetical protein